MYLFKYRGKTTSFKDFDEMVKWALSNNGVLDNYTFIMANRRVRHIFDIVGVVFIDSSTNRIVTDKQVYKMRPFERKENLISIFYISD